MRDTSIVITDCDLPGDAAEQILRAAGLRPVRASDTSTETLAELGADAEALIVQWHRIDGALMDRLPNLRFISRLGVGYDMVDVAAATERGTAVANTPSYCIEEVPAHTVAMILAQARRLPAYDRAMRDGVWKPVDARPYVVRQSRTTASVLGFGRIGSLVARGLRVLGCQVLVADPYAPEHVVREARCEPASVDDAIAAADILTLHVPLTDETRHLIDAPAIAGMKRGAVVVNTCRGPLIDETALVDALRDGRIGAAALDVFEAEPLGPDSALRTAPNVLLSGLHAPPSFREARPRTRSYPAREITRGVASGRSGERRGEQMPVLAVPLIPEPLGRDEPQRRRVHAVAQASLRGRPVIEDVSEMAVRFRGTHLRARHPQRPVGAGRHGAVLNGTREARPSGAAVELVGGREQRLAGHHVDVDPRLVVVPIRVAERRLGAVLLRDPVLQVGEGGDCALVLAVLVRHD